MVALFARTLGRSGGHYAWFLGTHWKPGEKIDFAPVVAELRYGLLFEPRRLLLTSRARLRQRRNLRGKRAGVGRIAGRSQDVVDSHAQ